MTSPGGAGSGGLMRRRHLFELTDLPGTPYAVRRLQIDYLRAVSDRADAHAVVLPSLVRAMRHSGARRIVDLCSGSGGPLVGLRERIEKAVGPTEFVLTDFYPNPAATPASFRYETRRIDARHVPEDLSGMRTLFEGFHHFAPDDARAILAAAVACREPIAIIEGTERTWGMVLAMALVVPLLVPLVTLIAIRPLDAERVLLTFVLPVASFAIAWDGLVSCLRTYTVDELREMTAAVGGDYDWDIGRTRTRGVPVTWAVGVPRA
jgi:hypothetical protein